MKDLEKPEISKFLGVSGVPILASVNGARSEKIIAEMGQHGITFHMIKHVPERIDGEKMVLPESLMTNNTFAFPLLFGMAKIHFLKKECLV